MKNRLFETKLSALNGNSSPDVSLLTFDLPAIIERLRDEEDWKKGERNSITLLKSSCVQLVLISLQTGAEIKSDESGSSIGVQLIEGKVKFHSEKESIVFEQGQFLTLHENIHPSLIAMEETVLLLTIPSASIYR